MPNRQTRDQYKEEKINLVLNFGNILYKKKKWEIHYKVKQLYLKIEPSIAYRGRFLFQNEEMKT